MQTVEFQPIVTCMQIKFEFELSHSPILSRLFQSCVHPVFLKIDYHNLWDAKPWPFTVKYRNDHDSP